MKLLHTADWHVGKVLKGVERLGEQREVLAEIVALAEREAVDAVLVAGDVFDSAAPVARSARSVAQASPWASAPGAADSKTSPATSTASTASRSASATISASTSRCSPRRSTPFSTFPTCQSAVWRSFMTTPRTDR